MSWAYWSGKGGVVGGGFLDAFPGARRIHSTKLAYGSYSGPCMQVTKDFVSFLDIGFVAGNIDEAALLAFSAGDDVFVSIWYDQSGNSRDWTVQSGNPTIVSSGVLEKINDTPSIYFPSGSSFRTLGSPGFPSENNLIYKIKTATTTAQTWYSAASNRYGLASLQGSTSTTFILNYGTPSFYKNKVSQSISNRGDVYNMIVGEPVIIEKSINVSSWLTYYLGVQTGGIYRLQGHLNDWIEFEGSVSLVDLSSISDLVENNYL